MKNKRQDEQWVVDSLIRAGYKNVIFGLDPPDLVLNGDIGIEVRRLNDHYFHNGKYEPVSTLESAFRRLCKSVFNEFPNSQDLPCAFASYTFFRPLEKAIVTRRQVRQVLTEHLPFIEEERDYELDRMEFRMSPATSIFKSRFELGGMQDGNRGGWMLSIGSNNLRIALDEKESILPRYSNNYDECWLALIDEIGYGISDFVLKELRDHISLTSSFDKILLFSPFHHFHFNTLYSKNPDTSIHDNFH